MKLKTLLSVQLLMFALLFFSEGFSQDSKKTIVQNIAGSDNYSIFAANIKAAGLSETLSGRGPFTVFMPTNKAFEKSPTVSVAKDSKPVNKSNLQELMTYHIVAGKMDSKAIASAIKAGNGKAVMTTLRGGKIMATMNGSKLILTDEKGNRSTVTVPDSDQSNGIIHVIDDVLVHK